MKTSEILKKAKTLIEIHGWTQGEMRSVDGCYCAVGAICAAAGCVGMGDGDCAPVRRTFKRLLAISDISKWNDSEINDKENVLEKFDAAIALAETEGI